MKDYLLDPPEDAEVPECPRCGTTWYTEIYLGDEGVVGCDKCVRTVPYDEWWYELEEERE